MGSLCRLSGWLNNSLFDDAEAAICFERGISTDERNILSQGRCDEHSIERVAVVQRDIEQLHCVMRFKGNRDKFQILDCIVYIGSRHRYLLHCVFDCYFVDRYCAQKKIIICASERLSGSRAEGARAVLRQVEEGMRVE